MFVEHNAEAVVASAKGSNTVLVAETGRSQHSTGKEIVTKFVTDRLVQRTTDFHDSLKKHKLNLYSGDTISDKCKTKKCKI